MAHSAMNSPISRLMVPTFCFCSDCNRNKSFHFTLLRRLCRSLRSLRHLNLVQALSRQKREATIGEIVRRETGPRGFARFDVGSLLVRELLCSFKVDQLVHS